MALPGRMERATTFVSELSPGAGGVWTQKVLCSFPGGSGGESPIGSLAFDSSGNLYGTAGSVAFELVHCSTGTWTRKILHHFAGRVDGADPLAGMVFDKAANLYGMTSTGGAHRGVVYELTPLPLVLGRRRFCTDLHRTEATDMALPIRLLRSMQAETFSASLEAEHRAPE